MSDIAKQLNEIAEAASFTLKDMATWCEQDRSAMRCWMRLEVEPHRVRQKFIQERLTLLKRILVETDKLPVPPTISQYERKQYVEQVRQYALGKFSKSGTSKRRI